MYSLISGAALVLLLSACSSNQSSEVKPHDLTYADLPVQQALEQFPNDESSGIPLDGRLRDEHMRMYVSVKIKQEQIRYEQARYYVNSQRNAANPIGVDAEAENEKLAIAHFEFRPALYYWAKRTITKTESNRDNADRDNAYRGIESSGKSRRISSFEEAVSAHNLSMIDKYVDELRFIRNYKLQPPILPKPQTANISQANFSQQMALIYEPLNRQ